MDIRIRSGLVLLAAGLMLLAGGMGARAEGGHEAARVPTPATNVGLVFRSLPSPCRVYDSRLTGGILEAATVRSLRVKGTCEVPDTARLVVGTIAATGSAGGGYFTGYAHGRARPLVATLNYTGDHTTSSAYTLPLKARGTFDLAVFSSARSHLVLDAVGYYEEAMQGRIGTSSTAATLESGTSHFTVRSTGSPGQARVDVDRDITGCAVLASPEDTRALAVAVAEDSDTFLVTSVLAADQSPIGVHVQVHVVC